MSVAAYRQTIRQSESPRQIERRILSQVTGRLDSRALQYDRAENRAERFALLGEGLRDDLAENQKIWNALRLDLSDPGNALPAPLRAQLISIATWIERQSTAVIGGAAGVSSLVAVNRAIIDGLAGKAPGPQG